MRGQKLGFRHSEKSKQKMADAKRGKPNFAGRKPPVFLICSECKITYSVQPYRKDTSKQCSKSCHNRVSGRLAGRAGKGVSRNKGNKRPDLTAKNKINPRRGAQIATWKGDQVSYFSLHVWIKRNYGTADICEQCNSTRFVQWANKDKKYTRDRDTWAKLCAKCHSAYDRQYQRHTPLPFTKDRMHPLRTSV